MSDKLNRLWVEKYRPKNIDEYVFKDTGTQLKIAQMVLNLEIPNLLLSGVQGSGKTSLVRVLINELEIEPGDIMVVNGSDETGVDTFRNKIKSFIQTFPLGKFKIVNIEEADYLSPSSQAILRQMTEDYTDHVRFVLTCNYENKIIPALKSRCQHFQFNAFSKDEITKHITSILMVEEVKFNEDTVGIYVDVAYPDIRKTINLLQQNIFNKELSPPSDTETGDYKFKILELLESGDWDAIRDLLCGNVSPGEWQDVYRFLYENLEKVPSFERNSEKWKQGIINISSYLYKHAFIADAEINFAGLCSHLSLL